MLSVTNNVGKCLGSFDADQQMNMIRRAAYTFGNASRCSYCAAQKSMQLFAPFIGDEELSVFGGKKPNVREGLDVWKALRAAPFQGARIISLLTVGGASLAHG